MDTLAELTGIAAGDLMQLIVLGVVLFVGLILLRIVFRLTATLFRLGCFLIVLIVAAGFVLNLLN